MVDLPNNGLLPATFRGVPFVVTNDSVSVGRRQAVHQYPGRDEPWAEDMGRTARRFRLRGFIATGSIRTVGGPIQLQRLLLLAALEKEGSGTLTHPTLGILNISVLNSEIEQDLGAGRMSNISLEFVESGKRSFPSLLVSGSKLLSKLAGIVTIAMDLVAVASIVSKAIGGKAAAASTSKTYAASVVIAGADATSLVHLAAQLPGDFGRFSAGANAGLQDSAASPYAADTSIPALISAASQQRVSIEAAANQVSAAAGNLNADADFSTLSDAVISLIDALLSACSNPADAVRLLIGLIQNPPGDVTAGTVGGVALIRVFQRSACFALARACGAYQPSSYDDAASLLARVADVIDGVAIVAADAGDDASFEALNGLLTALTENLRARGAELAPMKDFTLAEPLPDVVLAQRLYRDPSRADQLLGEIDPIHPLFCPTDFQALAA
ncbi:DNA circularization protein [Sphingomonas sp. UYP23]